MIWTIEIAMQSMLMPGSGGSGAIVDDEIVHDQYGLPYLPARRIKGLLRESAAEVCEMGAGLIALRDVHQIFGAMNDKRQQAGDIGESIIKVRNCTLADSSTIQAWLQWCGSQYSEIINPQTVLSWFTAIRRQTAIEKGVAVENTLRSYRVIARPVTFTGNIEAVAHEALVERVLALACANLRHMGSLRNRGLGEVTCRLLRQDGTDCLGEILSAYKKEATHV